MQLLSLYATPRRVKIVIYGNSVKYEEENSKKYTVIIKENNYKPFLWKHYLLSNEVW